MLKGRGAPKTGPEPKQESSKVKMAFKSGKSSKKADGTDDRFPYSEIKEIIAATQDSPTPKRGRGRPPKKSVDTAKTPVATPSRSKKKEVETPAASTRTPQGRYSTRGIRKNYLEMNSGVTIKKEPVSDNEEEDVESAEENEQSEEETAYRRTTRNSVRNTPKRKRSESLTKSSKRTKHLDDKEDEGEDEMEELEEEDQNIEANFDDEDVNETGSFFDDSEQELDDLQEESGDEVVVSSQDQRITDSTVKGLKTTNVSTSVPTVFKLGMRKVRMTRKRNTSRRRDENAEDETDDEVDKDDSGDTVNMKCSLCEDFTAETFADLTSHLVSFHHVYDPPRCDVCQRDFDNVQTLKLHLDRRHGPKPEPKVWKCTEEGCSKEFTSQNGLTGHVNRVHQGAQMVRKRYPCDKCSFECNSMDDIYEHKKVKHEIPIKCEECDKNFMNYQSLKSHNSLKHSVSGPASCDICNKTVSHPRYLKKHRERHFPPKYSCYICQKRVQSSFSLKAHLETHKPKSERSYKFICSYCGKPFALKANYEDHLNKHTGVRPYRCEICQRAFSFRSMLVRHKTFVHSSERPYKCGNCMKGFKFMNLLQNHMITHTNKSKHVCSTCSKCFTTASTLKFHQQKCKGAPAWNKGQLVTPQIGNTLILYTNQPETSPVKVTPNVLLDHASMVASENVSVEPNPGQGDMFDDGSVTEETVVMDGVSNTLEIPAGDSTQEVLGACQTSPGNTAAASGGEIEVYACSECNCTFGTYNEAEQHVLTAHSVQIDTVDPMNM